ncbi:MAG: rhodanese-like domain-containing protein [Marinifilaceae bacterium]
MNKEKSKQESLHPFFQDIDCSEAREIIKEMEGNDAFHIIDTRSSAMYKVGHLKMAILLDAFKFDFKKLLSKFPKDHLFLVYCTAGIRSRLAVNIMKQFGFQYIYHLKQGLEGCNLKGGELIRG